MAQIQIDSADGGRTNISVPDYALEATQQKMLDIFKDRIPAKTLKNIERSINKSFGKIVDSIKSGEDIDKETSDSLISMLGEYLERNNLSGIIDPKKLARWQKYMAEGEENFIKLWIATRYTTTAIYALAGAAYALIQETGAELVKMTEVGIGYRDSSRSVIESLGVLERAGLNASDTLIQLSDLVASKSHTAVSELIDSFISTAKEANNYGYLLSDLTDGMIKELNARQMFNIVDVNNRNKQSQLLGESFERFREHSKVLGVSTRKLQEFANSLFRETRAMSAFMLRLGKDARTSMFAGIQEFGAGMAAYGSDGERIAKAMSEAAFGGALGFSEDLIGYTAVLGKSFASMNRYISGIQQRDFDAADGLKVQQELTKQMKNLTHAEMERLYQIARIPGHPYAEHAESVARFALAVQRAAERAEENGAKFEDIQSSYTYLNNLTREFAGYFKDLRYRFLAGFFDAVGGFEGFKEHVDLMIAKFKHVGKAIGNLIDDIFGVDTGGEFKKQIKIFGKFVGKYLPAVLQGFVSFITGWMQGVIMVYNLIFGLFRLLYRGYKKFIEDPIQNFITKNKEEIDFVINKLSEFGDAIHGWVENIKEWFKGDGLFRNWFREFTTGPDGNETALSVIAKIMGAISLYFIGPLRLIMLPFTLFASALKIATMALWNFGKASIFRGKAAAAAAGASAVGGGGAATAAGAAAGASAVGGGGAATAAGAAAGAGISDKASKAVNSGTKRGGIFGRLGRLFGGGFLLKGGMAIGLLWGLSFVLEQFGKSFQAFTDLEWEKAAIGVALIAGLGAATAIFGSFGVAAVVGTAALWGLSLVLEQFGKSFQAFTDLEWEKAAIGVALIAGMGVIAFALGKFSFAVGKGTAALLGISFAMKIFGEAAVLFSNAFGTMIDQIVKLKDISPVHILGLAGALSAFAVALIGFTAGGVVSSAINLFSSFINGVGGLFGAKSPIQKLQELSNLSPNITMMMESLAMAKPAAESIYSLAGAFNKLSDEIRYVDFEKLNKFGSTYGRLGERVFFRQGELNRPINKEFFINQEEKSQEVKKQEEIEKLKQQQQMIKEKEEMAEDPYKETNDLLRELIGVMQDSNRLSRKQSDKLGNIAENI